MAQSTLPQSLMALLRANMLISRFFKMEMAERELAPFPRSSLKLNDFAALFFSFEINCES
jgi:hypothetical protein